MLHHSQFLRGDWTPAQLSSLIGWWDASDEGSITDSGGDVSQWNDLSGNGFHVTSTATFEPVTGSRTQNSMNVLGFATGDSLYNSAITLPSSGDASFYQVSTIDGVGGSSFASLFATDASDNDFQFASASTTQFNGQVTRTGANISLTGGPFVGPSIYNVEWDWTGDGTVSAFVDGTDRGSEPYISTKLQTTQEWYIFANRAGNAFIDGMVAETIIIEDCTDHCRQKVEGYLAHKWGIVSGLPSDHPYKSYSPVN